MIAAVVVWLLQDLLQILMMGFLLVPEFFLLVVIYRVLADPAAQDRAALWIWFAFFGGIIWDFRWAETPGVSGLVNVAMLAFVSWVWERTPVGGRSVALFAALAGGAHFFSGIAHYLAWATPSQAAVRMFLIQQFMTVPVLIVLCAIYAFRATDTHV